MKKKILSIVAFSSVACCAVVGTAIYAYSSNVYLDTDASTSSAAISLQSVPEETTSRTLAVPVQPETATKNDIYHMMLNSIDYYDQVSGTIYTPDTADMQVVDSIDFATSLSATTAHYTKTQSEVDTDTCTADTVEQVVSTDTPLSQEEVYCNQDATVTIDSLAKTYQTSAFDAISLDQVTDVPDEERITTAEDGQPCYSYRTNPTNVPDASISIFPQEMAFGFLSDPDLWEIDDITEWEGRTCYAISGTTTADYGAKLGVDSFTFLVDANTGVLLQYIGYNADGAISDYLYTENMQFEEQAEEVPVCSDAVLAGNTKIS